MAELKKEAGEQAKFRVIKGGKSPSRVLEVSSIGEYKPFHPSSRCRQADRPKLKLIEGELSEKAADETQRIVTQYPVVVRKHLMTRVLEQLGITSKQKNDSKEPQNGKTS